MKELDSRIRYQQIFETLDPNERKTKIVCTLRTGCQDVDMVVKMLDAGMNIARLDFGDIDGDQKDH